MPKSQIPWDKSELAFSKKSECCFELRSKSPSVVFRVEHCYEYQLYRYDVHSFSDLDRCLFFVYYQPTADILSLIYFFCLFRLWAMVKCHRQRWTDQTIVSALLLSFVLWELYWSRWRSGCARMPGACMMRWIWDDQCTIIDREYADLSKDQANCFNFKVLFWKNIIEFQ